MIWEVQTFSENIGREKYNGNVTESKAHTLPIEHSFLVCVL
ncbi:hypothetical protein EDB31_107192 [Vibrio crassostreae]|nr:hypothetical protein EDB31_107192 [Vibrio crassostreae]